MTDDTIKERIRTFLFKHIKDNELSNDENLFASGLLNSLFAMQLVMFTEKEFQVKVENEDLDLKNFSTINAIDEFVRRKL
ncbi:MAG: acyl carrier protein [Candidatus Marinimicrobia bacterium]|jgi:acyl carrier protein|nr:acyl carrier protein [Candidatus Scalindua sp.]MBT6304147.1 acyl carrier protein [Candidatus Neomarinimicrobiota bacterium]